MNIHAAGYTFKNIQISQEKLLLLFSLGKRSKMLKFNLGILKYSFWCVHLRGKKKLFILQHICTYGRKERGGYFFECVLLFLRGSS
jgi:hypothetical protein